MKIQVAGCLSYTGSEHKQISLVSEAFLYVPRPQIILAFNK